MLSLLENAVVVLTVAVIDAAIFAISPLVGVLAVLVTLPLTIAILVRRP